MVTSLPQNIQLKVEQALSQWRHWRCDPPLVARPEVLGVLGHGVSNFSILVGSDRQFVLRIDGVNPASHGLNRQSEWRALQAASSAGLAPPPRYFNPDLDCLICDYLSPDETREPCIADVAKLLREIHRLPARHTRLDLAERILRYEKQLEHSGRDLPATLARNRAKVFDILADTRLEATAPVLCHNDLLQANRIYSGDRLWAIDWEYCAMGSPWYDLAVVVVGDALGREKSDTLLEAYLGRQSTSEDWAQLHRHSTAYRYLELLWYLALDREALTDAQMQEKLAALEQALLSP